MKNQQGIIWAPIMIMVAVIVITGIAAYLLIQTSNTNQAENSNANVAVVNQANDNINVNSVSNTNNYQSNANVSVYTEDKLFKALNHSYILRTSYGRPFFDQQLIQNDAGQETIIVNSIHAAIPDFKEQKYRILLVFATPENESLIFFKSVLEGSDNPTGSIYEFNATTKSFRKMNLNEKYGSFFGGFAKSPAQDKFVWAPNPPTEESGFVQTLYVGDLLHDTYRVAVQLRNQETLNGGWYALAQHFELSWVDTTTLKYSVFDQSKKTSLSDTYDPENYKKLLIAEREVSL